MALAELTVGIAHGSFQSPHKPHVGVARRRHCPNFFRNSFLIASDRTTPSLAVTNIADE
ncbi:hypothetical protein [Nostoc sp.]|uniref:hypothetical protein n=1 Tax=Nostoc sp. TaxID=1180 RepID=UPI002FFB3D42